MKHCLDLFMIIILSFPASLSLSRSFETSICSKTSDIFQAGVYEKSLCLVTNSYKYNRAELFCKQNGMELFKIKSSTGAKTEIQKFFKTEFHGNKKRVAFIEGKNGNKCRVIRVFGAISFDFCRTSHIFFCEYRKTNNLLTTTKNIETISSVMTTSNMIDQNVTKFFTPSISATPSSSEMTSSNPSDSSTTKQSTTGKQTTKSLSTQHITEQLTSEQQTTKQPTTKQLMTEKLTSELITSKSITELPTTMFSTTMQPTAEQSTIKRTTSNLVTDQPTTRKQTTKDSTTKQSITEQLTSELTSSKQPTTGFSSTKQLMTEQLTTSFPESSTSKVLTITTKDPFNFCNISTCPVNQHIACNNNGSFYSTCNTPEAITMTATRMKQFLDAHNTYRNIVSTGQLSGFLPARRMAKLQWNEELARTAELNTKQCRMNHDKCHNTVYFLRSGQNLAMMSTTKSSYTIETFINDSMKLWFNEHIYANMSNINVTGTPSYNGEVINHFLALVTDRTTEVGCGISTYKTWSNGWNYTNFLTACNYASNNINGWPVYKLGDTASACNTGKDIDFPGLCSISENIDPNLNTN